MNNTIFFLICSKNVFSDPDAEEEEIATALITIATVDGELCSVNKPGGNPISSQHFDHCLKLALHREKQICELISSVLIEE